ncbi:Kinesin- protein 6 [Chytriomyces hyalinus]|nr:Kinesin- protein 6 [Chytriomyces hyalinus]
METDNLSETEMAATTSRRTINETFDFDADEQHPDTQTESEDDDGDSDDEEEGYALNSKQRAAANANPTVAAAAKTGSIKIFVRVRPPRTNDPKLHNTPGRYYCVNPNQSNDKDNSDADNQPKIGFRIPKDSEQGLINNQRENYDYKFNRVFDTDTTQDEVFDFVAKDVVLSAMEGYNGTIFAYGQTGSGKTFTITGGAERYSDRGLIPRTLQFIYKEAKARVGFQYEIGISYLEIYNEMGYDLLDSTRDAKKLEDLPRVRLQEGENQQIHVQNLSSITVNSEEEALNLLFVGDTNRMIAETPSNPASSRSHCLFIITIRCKKDGDDRMWKSKLHLVDLAGSERTSRTGIGGNLFKEATYINLSLHYLEQVIVALHEKHQGKRTHIPYRNSMMTSILRDSLGGNCMTTMIATCAPEDELIEESISTCRFAQRVALISNRAMLNEELDPKLVIARLKREIVRLKAELAIARGETEGESGELPDYERDRVKLAVEDYLSDTSSDAALIFSDARKIAEAFRIMKDKVIHLPNREVQARPAVESAKESDHQPQGQEMVKLQSLLAHRDNEINVLIGMINKYKTQLGESRLPERKSLPLNSDSATDSKAHSFTSKTQPQLNTASLPNISFSSSAASLPLTSSIPSAAPTPNLAASIPRLTTDMAKLFEAFKAEYPGSQWIEDQKAALKTKYTEAKKLGELANSLRIGIKHIKDKLAEPDTGDPQIIRAKQELRESITNKVSEYKAAYQNLKDMKLEIDHMEHLLEQARLRLSRAFEQWHDEVHVPTSSLARSPPFPRQRAAAANPKSRKYNE